MTVIAFKTWLYYNTFCVYALGCTMKYSIAKITFMFRKTLASAYTHRIENILACRIMLFCFISIQVTYIFDNEPRNKEIVKS